MGTKVNIIVGSHVWAEDADIAWVDGEVVKINGEEAEIQATNGKKIIANLSKLYPKDMEAATGGVDDMTKLSYLHEPGVLQKLAIRHTLEIFSLLSILSKGVAYRYANITKIRPWFHRYTARRFFQYMPMRCLMELQPGQ